MVSLEGQWCETCQIHTQQLLVARTRWCRLYLCWQCRGRNRVDLQPYTKADLYPYGEYPDPGFGGASAAEDEADAEWQELETVDGTLRYMSGSWDCLYGE